MPAEFHYFPFDAGPGAESTEQRWGDMMKWMRTTGILTENLTLNASTDDLAVTANATLGVQTAVGQAWVEGFEFQQQDDYYAIGVDPNTSGDPRIDLLVLELNKPDDIIHYVVVKGTPDPSPVAPSPQQDDEIWQMPLAEIAVADMAAVILSGDITDLRVRSLQGDGGSSAVTLESAGGSETLVAQGVGPAIETKGLSEGTGISLTSDASSVTITASGSPADSPTCFVYKNGTTTGLATASTTTITFDTAVLNPDMMWDSMSNPERITIDVDGIYYIHALVGWVGVALANGPVEAQVVLNGTTTIARSSTLLVGTDTLYLDASIFYDLSATDYLELDVINTSGQTLSLTSGASGPSLQAIQIRS